MGSLAWAGLAGWADWLAGLTGLAGLAELAGWLACFPAGCPNMCFSCGIRRVTTNNPMEMRIISTFAKKDAKRSQEAPGTPAEKTNFYRKL